jgi:hypothetical protein
VKQAFIPNRLLYGIVPDILLKGHKFWQNEDDSLTGYMAPSNDKSTVRSIITIKMIKKNKDDSSGFCNSLASAIISRKVVLDDPNLDPEEAEFSNAFDPSKPELYLVNILVAMSSFRTSASSVSKASTEDGVQASKSLVEFPSESQSLHALFRMILTLDTLGNVLVWTKTQPIPGTPISIDVVELPRLHLTFEKKVDSEGKIVYMCVEQSGLFITGYNSDLRFGPLIEGLPRVVLLKNIDEEYFALIPAIAKPVLSGWKGSTKQFVFTTSMSNVEWLENSGESAYFIYPIHSSGSFMSSKSIASSLYLLVVRLMTRKYEEAFSLIESCVSDVPYTKQGELALYITTSKFEFNTYLLLLFL